MEVVFIQVFFFTIGSKQKNKNENTGYQWHLHTIQKSALLKTREFHFSLVWVMEFSIISSCLGEVKNFPIILPSNLIVDVQRFLEKGNRILCVSNGAS